MGALIKFLAGNITGSDRRMVTDLLTRIVSPQILQTPLSLITQMQCKGRFLVMKIDLSQQKCYEKIFTFNRSVGIMSDARFKSFPICHLSYGLFHG